MVSRLVTAGIIAGVIITTAISALSIFKMPTILTHKHHG